MSNIQRDSVEDQKDTRSLVKTSHIMINANNEKVHTAATLI